VTGSSGVLGHLEDPEQADAAQHRDADGRDEIQLHQQRLQDAAAHHEAVEAVEQRHEVDLQAERVHLHGHLQREEQQQDLVGALWGGEGRGTTFKYMVNGLRCGDNRAR